MNDTPSWINDCIGMESYGIQVTDAYIGTSDKSHITGEVFYIEFESQNGYERLGYWYYVQHDDHWYWRGGSVKNIHTKVRDHITEHYNTNTNCFDT